MKISSTKYPSSPLKAQPTPAQPPAEPSQPADQVKLSLVSQIAQDPLPKGSRLTTLVPAAGGLAVGIGAGIIGGGIGAGAALPGVGILGVAGAALGSKIDHAGGQEGKKWTTILACVGAGVGAAGVVAGAVGGTAGAVASGLSLAGTGFALGHLLSH